MALTKEQLANLYIPSRKSSIPFIREMLAQNQSWLQISIRRCVVNFINHLDVQHKDSYLFDDVEDVVLSDFNTIIRNALDNAQSEQDRHEIDALLVRFDRAQIVIKNDKLSYLP